MNTNFYCSPSPRPTPDYNRCWARSLLLPASRVARLLAVVAVVGSVQAQPRIMFCARPSVFAAHELYSLSTNGMDLVRLTTDGLDKLGPVVSPDGSQVAYVRADLTGAGNIQIVPIAGGTPYTVVGANHA